MPNPPKDPSFTLFSDNAAGMGGVTLHSNLAAGASAGGVKLTGGGAGGRVTATRDLSVAQFAPANSTPCAPSVPELLFALPLIRGNPLVAVAQLSGSDYALQVQGQNPPTASGTVTVPVYNNANQPTALSNTMQPVFSATLARLGVTVNTPKIDGAAAVRGSAGDPAAALIRMSGNQLVRYLDYALGNSTGGGSPVQVTGLPTIVQALSQYLSTSTGNLEKDARLCLSKVAPTGRGMGEGPDCLIGGTNMMRALMATSSGQNGQSGVRLDPRTGRNIYHYMGVPFYRLNITDNTSPANTAWLFAANLGPTGLHLVHAYGSAETLGFQVDETTNSSLGARQFTIHGAFALMVWEPDAIYGVEQASIASL